MKPGDGWPLAEQVNVAVVPGMTVASDGCSVMVGGRGAPGGQTGECNEVFDEGNGRQRNTFYCSCPSASDV